MRIRYLHLPAGSEPPVIGQDGPFKAVLVIEQDAEEAWRDRIGDWLITSGCLYMMAWGQQAVEWHDSVDWALLTIHDFNEVPDDEHVMTTWHDDESLAEVFRFAGHAAWHATVSLDEIWIIDISENERKRLMLEDYAAARDSELSEPIQLSL
ncbi:MAG TPA: hypothetical protein VN018_03410 [Brevundimonas sp.]|nr:hypothetical protein [Brevundimonas sp.]